MSLLTLMPFFARSGFKVTLSGTAGSPNLATAQVNDPTNAEAGWRTTDDGGLEATTTGTWSDYSDEWGRPLATGRGSHYWVRATNDNGGDAPTGTNAGFGTWLAMSSTREWSHLRTTIGQDGPTRIKLEIATDSGGTNIIATGYYEITALVESGA